MRLTLRTNRWARVALLAIWVFSSGCQKLPHIDQSKPVPHETMGKIPLEDKEVKQADFLSDSMPVPLPKISRPRTTNDPECDEIWPMTLQEAIRIGLDNSEVVRVIAFGAQGIPVGGFEPTPLNTGAGSGVASSLGSGTLQTVYDPAVQETQIAQALSVFDTALTTSLLWGKSLTPFNNAVQGGTFGVTGPRYPVVSVSDQATFTAGLSKRNAVGGTMGITHNIQYLYQNSSFLVYPSVYTTNLQLTLSQPLMGSAPLPGQGAPNPTGLEANRAPIVISRLNADAAVWRFKAEVMASVRSIEQQYWSLAQVHVQHWAAEKAVELAREILKREQAELVVGKGTIADVAEAEQRLEQFNLDFVTRTSDLITTERQLRNILGLPPSDNRRIIPVTPPTEARLEPDWDASMAQMLSFQPDIVQQQLLVRISELQLLVARNQLLPQLNLNLLYQLNGLGQQLDTAEATMTGATLKALDPVIAAKQRAAGLNANPGNYSNFTQYQVGFTFQMPLGMRSPLANSRNAQLTLLRQRAFLQQIVHQTTHSLARFFLEIDANYKQFKTASRLRAAAATRLQAQRAYYEEGRITIDRFLDAVSQYATSVASEAQYKTTYNISIIALEEAKGTLLAYNNIAVSEGPHPEKAYIQARDQQIAHRQFPIQPDGPMYPKPITGTAVPDPVETKSPPGAPNGETRPALPAPVGPLGDPPMPLPPQVPAAESPVQTRLSPGSGDPNVLKTGLGGGLNPASTPAQPRASMPARIPTPDSPAMTPMPIPGSAKGPAPTPAISGGASPQIPATESAPDDDPDELPPLPVSIELPPLPGSKP